MKLKLYIHNEFIRIIDTSNLFDLICLEDSKYEESIVLLPVNDAVECR
jgi:hypothetical protein